VRCEFRGLTQQTSTIHTSSTNIRSNPVALNQPPTAISAPAEDEWTSRYVRGFQKDSAWHYNDEPLPPEIGESEDEKTDASEKSKFRVSRFKNSKVHPGTFMGEPNGAVGADPFQVLESPGNCALDDSNNDKLQCKTNLAWSEQVSTRFEPLRVHVAGIVSTSHFETLIGSIVLVNSFFIGFVTHFEATSGTQYHDAFFVTEWIFCTIFLVEMTLRLFASSYEFFRGADCYFNLLDLMLVILQLVELIVEAVLSTSADKRSLRILRAVKLIRLIRIARMLRKIRDLRTLILSIVISLQSLFWTLILLVLLIYLFALILTQLVADLPKDSSQYWKPDNKTFLHQSYGGLFRSMFSLFEALFGGQDWDVLVRPLMEEISPMMALMFVFYIAFSALAMMNVVTGVFVENVLECARKDNETFLINNVRNLFSQIDGGIYGLMNWEMFESKLQTNEMKAAFQSINIDTSEAKGLFSLLDLDGTRQVSCHEFLTGCLRLRGPAKALDLQILLREVRQIKDRMSQRWHHSRP